MATINLPSKYLSTSWAERPLAPSMPDEVIFANDIGPSGAFFISNGTRWQPMGGSCLIAASNVKTSLTGFVGEQIAISVLVPAGLMSANGQLEIFHLTEFTNSANIKRLRIRHNDTITAGTGSSYYSASFTTSNTALAFTYIKNDNAMNLQASQSAGTSSGFGSSGIAGATGTIDTSLNSYVIFNIELANASDLVSLESYWINYLEG